MWRDPNTHRLVLSRRCGYGEVQKGALGWCSGGWGCRLSSKGRSQQASRRRMPVRSSPYFAGQMAGRMALTACGRPAMMRRSVRRRLALDLTAYLWTGSLPKQQDLGSGLHLTRHQRYGELAGLRLRLCLSCICSCKFCLRPALAVLQGWSIGVSREGTPYTQACVWLEPVDA